MLLYMQAMVITARTFVGARTSRGEEGSVVEKVILTAVFAALAIAVGAIIVSKVTATANGISVTPPPVN
ncbi:MAG: hypothetical protein ACYDD4_02345 [Acidimicrobiales bacterium]